MRYTAACVQGTTLTTVGHVKDAIIPGLLAQLAAAATNNNPVLFNYVRASLKNWAVRLQQGRGGREGVGEGGEDAGAA